MSNEHYTDLEKRYLIEQRVKERIEKYGSIQNALSYSEEELKWCLDNWSRYSYDCVAHAITCHSLLIPRFKDLLK